jgi:hypothetical protein
MQWFGKVMLGDAMQGYGIVECRGATVMWVQAKCSFGIVIYRLAMKVTLIWSKGASYAKVIGTLLTTSAGIPLAQA